MSQDNNYNWYVIHTNSGYEEIVSEAIRQRAETSGLLDIITDVVVPKEKQIEVRNGKRKVVEKRFLPGYVLVRMISDKQAWYIVRNTPNVTGFVGYGGDPVPVSAKEIKEIEKRMGVAEPEYRVEFKVGDLVLINDGAFKGMDGKIDEIDLNRGKIKVLVNVFSRETPIELDVLQVKKV